MKILYLYLIVANLNGSLKTDIIVKKLREYRIQKIRKETNKIKYFKLKEYKKRQKIEKFKNKQFFKMEEIDNKLSFHLFIFEIYNKQQNSLKISMEVGNLEIKKYLSQFWNPAHELQNQFKVNSNSIQADIALTKIRGLKQMMRGLVKYILSGYIAQKQQINMDEIFAKLGSEFDFKGQECNLLLAFAAKQQIFNNAFLKSIQKKIIKVFQSLQNESSYSSQFQIEFDETINSNSKDQDKKIQQIQNPYANEKEIDMITQSESHERSNTTIVVDFDETQDLNLIDFKEDQNFNSDYFKVQNEQVKKYLNKLSKSTTELSYLCQRMKWSQPQFKQDKSKINQVLYACKASVNVRIKEKYLQMNNVCTGAVSKKQAKRVAALFLLRKIYNRIPQAWTMFQQSKKKNPMIQLELNANNQQIFKKEKFQVLDPSVFKEQEQKISECEISKKINQYLDSLKSFKSEMNLIIGRFKKISPPEIKPQKQDALSLWPVTTQIYDEDGTKLHYYAKQMSKKKAEETCCRQILFQLYRRNIPRWEQFQKYKKQKSLN